MSHRRNRRNQTEGTHESERQPIIQEDKGPWCNMAFEKFQEDTETWDTFIGRLENYFAMMNVGEEHITRKTQVLINTMGVRTYQQLCDHLSPDKPSSKDYQELVDTVDKLLNPRPSTITEQYNFTARRQREGESIHQYICDLKKAAKYCSFKCERCKASTQEAHIRQQFISGLQNKSILKEMLKSHENMSLSECVGLAQAMEKATEEADIIQGKENVRVIKSKVTNEVKNYDRCYRCGSTNHDKDDCLFKSATCFLCKKVGHIKKVCRYQRKGATKQLAEESFGENESNVKADEHNASMQQLNSETYLPEMQPKPKRIMVDCEIDQKRVTFEYDTGSTVSTISSNAFLKLFPERELSETKLILTTYTGEVIRPLGFATVTIKMETREERGNIYVLPGPVQPIFGREWMILMKTNANVCILEEIDDKIKDKFVQSLKTDFQTLFNDDLGKIPEYKGHIKLKEGTIPIFKPPRPLPYSLKGKVEQEIDRLEKEGIITKVSYSAWGTPVVPVTKPDGTVRLCADYKVSVNRAVENCSFPIPRVEDIFASIGKGKVFTTLDIKQAYLNVEMDDESAMIQAISTTKGVYRVNRLMFGITMAPAIWQEKITMILAGIEGVHVFYDDIIVEGKDLNEHNSRLRAVMSKLVDNNLRVNWNKCKCFERQVQYLGHIISANGITKSPEKVVAVRDAPRPQNVNELRSWLGLVNYYGKFITNLATKLNPLYKLLEKGSKFRWTAQTDSSFNAIKQDIISDDTLIAYDPDLPLIVATDASPVGLGAVLSHRLPDGTERPICFASRCLSAAEKNYSQIDKEATAIYWALHKFFRFCYGRRFELITDHKPLVAIFNPKKEFPTMSAQRLLRYALFIQGFDYDIIYKSTKQHSNADALSRLPLQGTVRDDFKDETTLYHLDQISQLPVSCAEIQNETETDKELKSLLEDLMKGDTVRHPQFSRYSQELCVDQKCVFRGARIIVPSTLRRRVLEELHSAHVGMSKMKTLARAYVWWPQLDMEIEEIVRNCPTCAQFQTNPPKAPDHPWETPHDPFQRVHIDHAGPFRGQTFLLIVDAYTKWLEVFPVRNTTSKSTIEKLRETFSRFGLPATLVSDNGTSFTSQEFESFLKENGIIHKTIAPYHPSSNGQAERYVQTLKSSLNKMMDEKGDINLKLACFLMANRRAPHTTTNTTPSQLMLGRTIKTRLDLLRPSVILDKACETRKVENSTICRNIRCFEIGDSVLAKAYNSRYQRWEKGVVLKRLGQVMYLIELEDGRKTKKHIDQLKKGPSRS